MDLKQIVIIVVNVSAIFFFGGMIFIAIGMSRPGEIPREVEQEDLYFLHNGVIVGIFNHNALTKIGVPLFAMGMSVGLVCSIALS